jgi:hypothetical protein
MTYTTFSKIADLLSKDKLATIHINTSDPALFQIMCSKGCYYNFKDLDRLANTAQLPDREIWNEIFQAAIKKNESFLFRWLAKSIYERADSIKRKLDLYGADLTIQYNGESFLNYWIENNDVTLVEHYKHLINHPNSSGQTPLITAIKKELNRPIFVEEFVQRLLEMGADPNQYKGKQRSPLVTVLAETQSFETRQLIANNLINLLVLYGADINAPCWFEGRMWSPLMVAVHLRCPMELLRMMRVLGASTHYQDQYGLTLVDYAKKKYPGINVAINLWHKEEI